MLPLGMLVLGPLGMDTGAGQCQTLPMTNLREPVWNNKEIHSLWLPLLSLGMC